MYTIHLSQAAQDFVDKLDKHQNASIVQRLKRLEKNPIPSKAKFICRDFRDKVFRYRIGNYRALYKIKETENIILIVKI